MKKIKLKKHLSIFKHNHETGFTLIELLISLSLMSLFLLITLPIWNSLQHQSQTEYFSVYQFFHIATDEVQQNQIITGTENQLIIQTIDNDQIVLSHYYDIIRRQVNRAGHEILLRGVKSFDVVHNDNDLLIKIMMKSGNKYEKIITKFN